MINPGYCRFDEKCAVYDRHLQLSGMASGSFLCYRCRSRSENYLNLLRYDYVDLSQHLPPADRRGDAKIFRPKPGPQIPMDLTVYTLRGEIAWYLTRLAHSVRSVLGQGRFSADPPAHWGTSYPVREGFAVDQAVRFLTPRVDAVAGLGNMVSTWTQRSAAETALDGLQLLDRVAFLHHTARRLVGVEPKTVHVPGYCPKCQVPSLHRSADDEQVIWCVSCRASFDQQTYLAHQLGLCHPNEGPREG